MKLRPLLFRYAITDEQQYASWYFLFDFFWTTQFLAAFGEITLACVFATWYFTYDERKGELARVVPRSIKCVVRHHLGTAAFGSFVIAVVQLARAAVMYVQKRMNALARHGGWVEKATKAVLCCIACCLWCVEKCLKFINRNAYIQTGIFGHGFCRAGKEAFHLILRNLARIGALQVIGAFIFVIGKVFIALCSTLACYAYLTTYGPNDYYYY